MFAIMGLSIKRTIIEETLGLRNNPIEVTVCVAISGGAGDLLVGGIRWLRGFSVWLMRRCMAR